MAREPAARTGCRHRPQRGCRGRRGRGERARAPAGRWCPSAGTGPVAVLNVLFLTHSFPREPADPVGSLVLRLAVALRDADINVQVMAPGAPGLASRDLFEGILVERFRYAPRA